MDQNSLVIRFFKALWNLLKRLGSIIGAFFKGFSSKIDTKKKSSPKEEKSDSEPADRQIEEKEE